MAWSVPKNSKRQVDKAGRALAEGRLPTHQQNEALQVINNWRSSHSFPMNTFQVNLRQRARRIDNEALVAQRLKRVPSIVAKLRRFDGMKLSRMQDIGGCRAVVGSVDVVFALCNSYLNSEIRHVLVNQKDYIAEPKASGYRGVHLVYRYRSDRNETYNGHLIEVQIRSGLQHAWATAVETMGTFLRQALKSSEGSTEWLHFFALVSSAFAIREGCKVVPGTPTDYDVILEEIRSQEDRLKVADRLTAFGEALRTLEDAGIRGSKYYLMVLKPAEETLDIVGYRKNELAQATEAYLEAEKSVSNIEGADAVLVAADSLDSLRKAYPNYFLDTKTFLAELSSILGGKG
ncbi:hypothetical protein TVD_09135 [Thioalkalivibrio versutus]|uniref:RelA/SpoT domain-containing protein n=1 Tax=Thioalkalivibrio versutus TaxID=106634 RepID=A0A0G3G7W2_9GAMM|nr:RelA/SpoT domain-containing protein [Thioalkalivibrio versutus]AKJ96474.1 hypothetical protein TVD_09135 [Thioalkalivibrio versutus]